jgi:hypothetical protein
MHCITNHIFQYIQKKIINFLRYRSQDLNTKGQKKKNLFNNQTNPSHVKHIVLTPLSLNKILTQKTRSSPSFKTTKPEYSRYYIKDERTVLFLVYLVLIIFFFK